MGSFRSSGKRRADLENEVGIIAIAIRDALKEYDRVVAALEHAAVDGILAVTQDLIDVAIEHFGETRQRRDSTGEARRFPSSQKRRAAARERYCHKRFRSSLST
jgi:hypothetical protein